MHKWYLRFHLCIPSASLCVRHHTKIRAAAVARHRHVGRVLRRVRSLRGGASAMNPLAPPALARASRAGPGRRHRRPGARPLPRILRRQHPQPAHVPRLQPGRGGVPGLVRRPRRAVDRARRAVARRHLDRNADAGAIPAERQAAARGASPPVRLACDRPGRAGQSTRR
jgi:hypothetical protein